LVGVADQPATADLLQFALIGVLSHTFACTLNDIADLEADRLNPARSISPLVSGTVSTAAAKHLVVAQLVVALVVSAVVTHFHVGFMLSVGLLFGSIAFSNVYQKSRVLHPLAMDIIYGCNMGAPALICCIPYRFDVLPVVLLGAAFGVQMVLLNVIAGNIKDLEHDRSVGDDTTAIRMGVRVTDAGTVIATAKYLVLSQLVNAISVALLLAIIAIAPVSETTRATMATVVLAVQGVSWYSMWQLLTGQRRASNQGREAYLLLNFVSLILAAALFAPIPVSILAVVTAAWLPLAKIATIPPRRRLGARA